MQVFKSYNGFEWTVLANTPRGLFLVPTYSETPDGAAYLFCNVTGKALALGEEYDLTLPPQVEAQTDFLGYFLDKTGTRWDILFATKDIVYASAVWGRIAYTWDDNGKSLCLWVEPNYDVETLYLKFGK